MRWVLTRGWPSWWAIAFAAMAWASTGVTAMAPTGRVISAGLFALAALSFASVAYRPENLALRWVALWLASTAMLTRANIMLIDATYSTATTIIGVAVWITLTVATCLLLIVTGDLAARGPHAGSRR